MSALAFGRAAAAQEARDARAPSDSGRTVAPLCWRGRTLPRCGRFVVTEVGFYRPFKSSARTISYGVPPQQGPYTYTEPHFREQLTWEVGLMMNRTPTAAYGGTLVVNVGDGGGEIGVKGRARRWLSADGMALDLGAGVMTGRVSRQLGERDGVGLTTDVALNAADYGALVLRLDLMRAAGESSSALSGGVRLGSKPAIIGSAVLGVGILILAALISGTDY